MKIFGWAVAGVLALVVLGSAMFGLKWLGLEWRGFFGPKEVAIERDIYEQSPSFVHSRVNDLARYRIEWLAASEDERAALNTLIRQQMSQLDPDAIRDPDLRSFYDTVMGF